VELRSPDLVLGFAVNKDVIPSNWNGAIATGVIKSESSAQEEMEERLSQ
jgi:hypothetical protein